MNIQQYQMQSRGGGSIPNNGMPRLTGNRIQDTYNLGVLGADFPIQRFDGRQQIPTATAGPPMQQPPMDQYQFRSPGLQPPGGQPPMMAGTSRRRPRRMGFRYPQRDVGGNVPGEWDYQMGRSPGLQPPMVPYGQQQGGYQFSQQPRQQMVPY